MKIKNWKRLNADHANMAVAVEIAAIILLGILWRVTAINAAPTADCNNGNFFGTYQTEDVSLTGDLFVTSNVTIRNSVTLTITAGSDVTLCGEYQIHVTGGGDLVAIGTSAEPITFTADDPGTNWDAISFVNQGEHSVLQFVALSDGGGNDSNADNASIFILNNLGTTVLPSPSIDNVTINDSGAYGISISMLEEDPTPPSITNISINNSANAAILTDAEALGGLGKNNSFSSNQPNVIQIRSGGNRLNYSQHWRNPGVPIEVLGDFMVAAEATDPPAILTIDSDMTFLMYPQTDVFIGSSSNRRGSLVINGTEAAPVTFTRLDDVSAPWGNMRASLYPDTVVTLEHVNFSYGGDGVAGMLYQLGSGAVSLDHVSVQNSLSSGIYGQSGQATINNSSFELNDIGLELNSGFSAIVRNSTIANNVTAGVNVTDNGSQTCIDALGNYWGANDGPTDSDGGSDACDSGRTNGGGSNVSNGVLYDPWLTGSGTLQDRGQIAPDKFYIIADGVDTARVEITLRDAQGNPAIGKEVHLKATTGIVVQPTSLTDSMGKATAIISGTISGYAYLTAHNVTDDKPVAGIGGVTFWQGSGDAGGLISVDGTPYASPNLIISGKPFQVGLPVGMSVPMRNGNFLPVDVTVIYGVSNLSVGLGFDPVYSATQTLQPGETWDAPGVWLPVSAGHRCIQAAIEVDDGQVPPFTQDSSNLALQYNTNQNPCNPELLDPGRAIPRLPGRVPLVTIAMTFVNLHHITQLAVQCIDESLNFYALTMNGERDYQLVVTPETFTPPTIPAGDDITEDQAAALNDLAETSAELLSLNRALGATAQRMNWASQAASIVSGFSSGNLNTRTTSSFSFLDLQHEAYRDFANQYADKLDQYSDEIDLLLAATPGADTLYFRPEDFQNTRDEISANGFGTEVENFYQQTGLSDGLISQLENDIVADFDGGFFEHISWSYLMHDIQTEAAVIANRLRAQNPLSRGLRANESLATDLGPTVFVRPVVFQFDVGHPFNNTREVDLVVKPVNLPLNWTYGLSSNSITLDSDEVTEATLTLFPGDERLEGDLVQVMVEGYVDGELVGGILMEHNTPHLTSLSDLYLPAIMRP